MTVLTPELREGLRLAIDEQRRQRVEEQGGYKECEAAERHTERGPRSVRLENRLAADRLDVLESEQKHEPPEPAPPTPARAHKARRLPRLRRCGYCGAPCYDAVCAAHEDLL